MKFVGISGSLRSASYNTALLQHAIKCLPEEVTAEVAAIGEIPLYNQELDGETKPPSVQRLLDTLSHCDGLIIACPEYNYGIPGGLKNAIDWISRPAYKSVLAGKPTLIMSASQSPFGGVRALGQLKQVLAGTLTPVYPAPELAVGSAQKLFENGELKDEVTLQKLSRLVQDFCHWVRVE